MHYFSMWLEDSKNKPQLANTYTLNIETYLILQTHGWLGPRTL